MQLVGIKYLKDFCKLKLYSSILIDEVYTESLPRNTLRAPPTSKFKVWFRDPPYFETLLNTFQMPNIFMTSRTNHGVFSMFDFTRYTTPL